MFGKHSTAAVAFVVGATLASGIAAAATKTPTSAKACVTSKGSLALQVKGKCAKGTKKISLGTVGPVGAKGDPGTPGLTGAPGPAGAQAVFQTFAGTLSTTSSTYANLGGPSVTVDVGPSGLVQYWVRSTMTTTSGTAAVEITDASGAGAVMTESGSTETIYSLPSSGIGTNHFNAGLSTDYVGPGRQTFTLQFNITGGGTAFFTDTKLVVIPV